MEPYDRENEEVSRILLTAAQELAAVDNLKGMPTAVVIAYLITDEDGGTWNADAYEGSITTALGLLEQTKYQLLKFQVWGE